MRICREPGPGESQAADLVPCIEGSGSKRDAPRSRSFSRPAAALALALAVGSWAGSLLAGDVLVPGGLLLAMGPLLFVRVEQARRSWMRPGIWVLLVLVSGLRAFEIGRGANAGMHSGNERGASPANFERIGERIGERIVIGRWQSRSRASSSGLLLEDPAREEHSARVVYDLDGARPRDGEWVAVLPGDPVIPLPRGALMGPLAREGIRGRRHVRADAWFPLQGPLVHGDRSSCLRDTREFLLGTSEHLRAWYRKRLDELDQQGAPKGLTRALVLGESEAVPRQFEDLTRRTGVRHLLAVSGMHVGLICLLIVLPIKRRAGRCAGLLFLGLFVLLTGAGSPVLRAALAAGLALLAPKGRISPAGCPAAPIVPARRIDAATLWSLALAFELIVNPRSLARVGVQLSYLATLGILVGARPIAALLRRSLREVSPFSCRVSLYPGRLQLIAGRASGIAITLLAASLAAILATTPVTWAIFGEAAPVGLVMTPLALVPIALALLVGLFAPLLPISIAAFLLQAAGGALVLMLSIADRLPGTPVALPPRPWWLLASAGFTLLWLLRHRSGRPLVRTCALLWALLLLPWSPAPARFELYVLDSGHGTCAIARGPGLSTFVFDAGSRDRSGLYREAIAPLLAHWDQEVTMVVLSHDHRDHQSAMGTLLTRHPPALFGGVPSRSFPLPSTTKAVFLETGRVRLPLGRHGPIEAVLIRAADQEGNEGSAAIEFVLTKHDEQQGRESLRILLEGDAEAQGLRALLEAGTLPRDVALLLAPHHGSDTPLLASLLEWTRPGIVWVTSGKRPPIAAELERRSIVWRCPSLDGPLRFVWPGPSAP